ncbi:hypothetical protein K0M31_017771 [Melipona bicolor]|uniref:Odorant receptor n=1 Tax=Melipona bicolor TaxID=60889 RepID=A0AA40KSU9_9HYME|nr:hypothetical protein K0M31_017771 [Melipona bicolor]
MHPSIRNHADQPRNPNYKKDIAYVTKYLKWILNSIGIWPAVLKGVGKFLPKITIGLSNLVVLFIEVQCVLHILLEEKDPFLRMRLLGLICYTLISLLKYSALTIRKSKIKYCIEQMYADWKQVSKQVEFERDRTLMLKYGKIGRNLTIYSAVFMYSGNMCYITIMQYAIGSHVDENNRTIKMLVYPTYSGLFDVQKTPIYEIVYVLQCMCTFMLNTVTASCCGLAALFATHACGQIDVIMSQLNDLTDEKFSKKNCNPNARLREIVQHHIRILKYKRQGKVNHCPSLIKTISRAIVDSLR